MPPHTHTHRFLTLVKHTCHELHSLSQDALSLLAEKAELSDEEGRGVAFRRAAAVLKALPAQVTSMSQLRGLPCLGEHSLRVIKVSESCSFPASPTNKMLQHCPVLQDVLENGKSSEVESTKQSERYRTLKVCLLFSKEQLVEV